MYPASGGSVSRRAGTGSTGKALVSIIHLIFSSSGMWKSGSPSAIDHDRSPGSCWAVRARVRHDVGMSSVSATADLTEHVERLDRDGFTIVHDAFTPLLAEQLSADIDRLESVGRVTPADND